MKGMKIWVAPLALLLGVAACDDLLVESPESFLAPENFYRTAGDAEAAMAAVYSPLSSQAAFQYNLWVTLDGGSDEGMSNPVVPSALVQSFGQLNYSPTQDRITENWRAFYAVITRANILIERLPAIEAQPEVNTALAAEARFLRALSYYYLVRLYGDVPLVITEEDALERDMPRSPVEEVYQLIIADAQEAANGLPVTRTGTTAKGRATKGAALSLLADVHLTRQDWQKAADYAKQVIELNRYGLQPNYLNAFLPTFEGGIEDIFSVQFVDSPGLAGSFFAYFYFPREVGNNRGGGWAWIVPNPVHVASYLPGDYRREVTYSDKFISLQTGQEVTVDKQHTYKFRPSQVANTGAGDVNAPIYRYADVLLMYAEALNELGQPGEAVQYLNQIRARARQGTGSESRVEPADYAGPVSQAEVREAIFQERKWELAHEGKRWFDMVRRGQDYWASQLQQNDAQAIVAAHKMLLPIPETEVNQNTALTQNPGY